MFHHYNDPKIQKIIDKFIISSTDDKELSGTRRNIDNEPAKLGISYYQMMFILIQKRQLRIEEEKRSGLTEN